MVVIYQPIIPEPQLFHSFHGMYKEGFFTYIVLLKVKVKVHWDLWSIEPRVGQLQVIYIAELPADLLRAQYSPQA